MSETRVVMVVGGGRGIGEAVARRFAEAGDRLIVGDVDGESAVRVAAGMGGVGYRLDVRDESCVATVFADAVGQFGRLDVMINTAGVFRHGVAFYDICLAEWQEIIDVNLTGTFLCTREATRHMLPHAGASIINFSSGSGVRANQLVAAYGASKAAVSHFTRNAAIDLAARGIRVNAVSPGATHTPMLEAAHDVIGRSLLAQGNPLRRLLDPVDVAGTVFFLASDEARFITGEVINVDGGAAVAGRMAQQH